MLQINKVTVNYEERPIGISEVPKISWIIESDEKNIIQEEYRLQVAADAGFKELILESYQKSRQSVLVKPSGLVLKSGAKYYVRVKVKDNKGRESDWSQTAYFVTGLLHNDEWQAQFISAESEEDALNSKTTYVRKEFTISKEIQEAYVFSTALGLYNMYLNGEKVGEDELTPGWTSYHKHLCYQTYEVTCQLKKGRNAIGTMLGAGWYKGKMGFLGFSNNYGSQTAFLAQLLIKYKDGSREIIGTDTSWKGEDAPVVFAEIYDGEIYDAAKEKEGWNLAGYDDSIWRRTEEVKFNKKVLTAQSGCKVQKIDELPVKEIIMTPEGETVLDFGQNMTGWVTFTAEGKAGDEVELNCFEVLDHEGNVYLENLRKAKQTIIYRFNKKETVTYTPHFTFQGFRYVRIKQYPGQIKKENFIAHTLHSKMEQTGFLRCSNPDLNQLQHNILWGLKGNFVDIPTDCPQRDERVGWTGDAQIFCPTASYLMNTYLFFEKWLKDVAADQTIEGGVPHVVPDILSNTKEKVNDWLVSRGTHSAAAWGDVAVLNPWNIYLAFGDKDILVSQYRSMKAWVNFMRSHSRNNLWNYRLQFGDWVALDAEEGSYFGATPLDLTCTAYYAHSAEILAKAAQVLGKEEDYKEYLRLSCSIKDTFAEKFFEPDGSMKANTQTAYIIALYFDLTPEKYKAKAVECLLELLRKENGHLVTGFIGTPYFTYALSQNGHLKEAYDLLLKDDFPSWLYQVKQGATTIWEHWDGIKPDGSMWSPAMNSFNHYAYGAIGEWMYNVIGGIQIDEKQPGYKHILLEPQMGGGLTYAETEYDSIYGTIKVHWQIEEDKVILEVKVPVNTTATLKLSECQEVMKADGLIFRDNGGQMAAELGSGSYIIAYRKNKTN